MWESVMRKGLFEELRGDLKTCKFCKHSWPYFSTNCWRTIVPVDIFGGEKFVGGVVD